MAKYIFLVLVAILPITISSAEIPSKEDHEIHCLATNMYYEARGESEKGVLAVALVTMNRVKDSLFPDSVCEVVFQKVKKTCQFSWVCKKPKVNFEEEKFQKMLNLAKKVYNGQVKDFTRGATHFHNATIQPNWASAKVKTLQIGNHIFYRRKK